MATTLRLLLLVATGSVTVLGTALTLWTITAPAPATGTAEFVRRGEGDAKFRNATVPLPAHGPPAHDGCGTDPGGGPPLLGSLLRMPSVPAGCSPPPG